MNSSLNIPTDIPEVPVKVKLQPVKEGLRLLGSALLTQHKFNVTKKSNKESYNCVFLTQKYQRNPPNQLHLREVTQVEHQVLC